jgi:uncharacterized membrane protein
MARSDFRGIESTAKLGTHPIHPMLIPFPIALLVATFACDIAYWATHNGFWGQAAFWALGAAIIMALLAAVAGFIDFVANARIRAISEAWQHMIGNLIAVTLALVSFYVRYRYGAAAAVLPWGIVASAVIVAILLFTGWRGGDLVYVHRVGVEPDTLAEAPPSMPTSRSDRARAA